MNKSSNQKQQRIFERKAHAGVVQDKYPPERIKAGSPQPATATPAADMTPRVDTNSHHSQNSISSMADNRLKHHGSEKRQTLQIASRVKPAVKSEVARLSKLKGWTESHTIAVLVESALAHTLAEQFGVMLKATIQDAVTKQIKKESQRTARLALNSFLAAEQSRILVIHILSLLLGRNTAVLPQLISQSQKQARANLRGLIGESEKEK